MSIKWIDSLTTASAQGKKILVRLDLNVPLEEVNGKFIISDTTRIDASLPTLKYLLELGPSKLVIMSHLGRPKGGHRDHKFSLEPVATYLAEKLAEEITLTETALDAGIQTLLHLNRPRIIMLENLRYHEGEEKNETEFAAQLSKYGDFYVNDAFGVSHRKHASVYQIITHFKNKAYGGFLLKKEIESLSKMLDRPEKPFVALLGGAKVSDKVKCIEKLLPLVDNILLGGAMAYPFLKAKGIEIGKSLCSDADVVLATSLLRQDRGQKMLLPVDHLAAQTPEAQTQEITHLSAVSIPAHLSGFDIGEKTVALFIDKLQSAKTIFWNGPMGFFEKDNFASGTKSLALAMSKLHPRTFTVVGGGDSVAAVTQFGMEKEFSHVSTGGGASLEFIEQGDLPGVKALKFGVN
jgi:phosphoglycerate kinase